MDDDITASVVPLDHVNFEIRAKTEAERAKADRQCRQQQERLTQLAEAECPTSKDMIGPEFLQSESVTLRSP